MKTHILLISNLYPSRDDPNRGVFIRQLTEEISQKCNVSVICPVPWRPKLFYKLRGHKSPPKEDRLNGINILYPRYIVIPKILRFTYAWFMYLALRPAIKTILSKQKIDLISAHWVYPDGVATIMAAHQLGVPITLHALGCDINEYTKFFLRRLQISKALKLADRVMVKSSDLFNIIEELGVDKKKIRTILNGVDQEKFYPLNVTKCREELSLNTSKKYLLFVGNIQIEKGLEFLIKGIPSAQGDFELLIIGSGPLADEMKWLVKSLNLSKRVHFLGQLPHDQIAVYLNAVDALCLPSLREGCPNIVLESLSCGTPVLASNVGAVPEILTRKELGIVVPPMCSKSIAEKIPEVLLLKEKGSINFDWYSWEKNAEMIINVFDELIKNDTRK